MSPPQPQPAFGLSFDPRALTDLLQAPSDIRDIALDNLRDVVNAQRTGLRLTGDLEGYRKLFVDYRYEWRLVYGIRPAPPGSEHARDIHVIACRPRAGNDVYDEVGRRLGIGRRPLSATTHAARSAPPQLATPPKAQQPRPLPSSMPAARPTRAAGTGLPAPAQPSQGRNR